jgi:hypothetical protein
MQWRSCLARQPLSEGLSLASCTGQQSTWVGIAIDFLSIL